MAVALHDDGQPALGHAGLAQKTPRPSVVPRATSRWPSEPRLVGERGVGYHLFGVYVWPDLLHGSSPELRKRMQGKSGFNFTALGDGLLDELDRLTAACVEAFASRTAPGT